MKLKVQRGRSGEGPGGRGPCSLAGIGERCSSPTVRAEIQAEKTSAILSPATTASATAGRASAAILDQPAGPREGSVEITGSDSLHHLSKPGRR